MGFGFKNRKNTVFRQNAIPSFRKSPRRASYQVILHAVLQHFVPEDLPSDGLGDIVVTTGIQGIFPFKCK
jgi:hypothetical protein